MPRTRPGRSPRINGTDPIHASKRPFPRHGCAITNSGPASRESTTFTAIAICSARASRSRKLLIPKTRGTLRASVRTQAFLPVRPEGFQPVQRVSMDLARECQKIVGRRFSSPFLLIGGQDGRPTFGVLGNAGRTGWKPVFRIEFERESGIFVRRVA